MSAQEGEEGKESFEERSKRFLEENSTGQ